MPISDQNDALAKEDVVELLDGAENTDGPLQKHNALPGITTAPKPSLPTQTEPNQQKRIDDSDDEVPQILDEEEEEKYETPLNQEGALGGSPLPAGSEEERIVLVREDIPEPT